MIPIDKKISRLVLKSGKTQVALAREIGVHRNTLQNVLKGRQTKNISLRFALGISKALGITVEELVKDTEYEIK